MITCHQELRIRNLKHHLLSFSNSLFSGNQWYCYPLEIIENNLVIWRCDLFLWTKWTCLVPLHPTAGECPAQWHLLTRAFEVHGEWETPVKRNMTGLKTPCLLTVRAPDGVIKLTWQLCALYSHTHPVHFLPVTAHENGKLQGQGFISVTTVS